MRRLVVALAFFALGSSGMAVPDEPPRVSIRAGEERPMNVVPRWQPNCDDPSVAWITADGKAILKAVKPGRTLCSLADDGGHRFVWEIVVTGDPTPQKE